MVDIKVKCASKGFVFAPWISRESEKLNKSQSCRKLKSYNPYQYSCSNMVSCKSNPVNKRLFKMLEKKHPVNHHPFPIASMEVEGAPSCPRLYRPSSSLARQGP